MGGLNSAHACLPSFKTTSPDTVEKTFRAHQPMPVGLPLNMRCSSNTTWISLPDSCFGNRLDCRTGYRRSPSCRQRSKITTQTSPTLQCCREIDVGEVPPRLTRAWSYTCVDLATIQGCLRTMGSSSVSFSGSVNTGVMAVDAANRPYTSCTLFTRRCMP